jgi:hypothetical protein
MTKGSPKSRFWNILVSNPDLVIAGTQINGTKMRRTTNLIKKIVNLRQRITILNSNLVQETIVLNHPERTILFQNE